MAEAPAISRTGFFPVYPDRDGVTLTGKHAAVITAPTRLKSEVGDGGLPNGAFDFRGYEGFDLIFAGTGSDNDDFNFEIWYWYLVSAPTAPSEERLWFPKLVGSSATGANANELGNFVGVDGKFIENELRFADVIGAITNSGHQDFLEKFNKETSVIEVESPGSDGVAMVSVRSCGGVGAVEAHVYETGAGIATTMQVFARLTRGIAHN